MAHDEMIMPTIKEDLAAFAQAGERLKAAGLLRTNSLVGDVGEWIAARYYGVQLANTVTRGYDLTTREGQRVQVKTLKDGNDGRRMEAGKVLGPCDLLLMIRLAPDYTPIDAIEVGFDVVQEVFGDRPVRWSRKFGRTHECARSQSTNSASDSSGIPSAGHAASIGFGP